MKKIFLTTTLAAIASLQSCKHETPETKDTTPVADVTTFVDPLIGTGGHGHTYPGATVPFGMIQLSPDNGTNGWDWCSGYNVHDSIVVGFSHLHLSGTGIGDLADILFMPTNKKVDLTTKIKTRDDYPYKSKYTHAEETATPGFYSLYLEDPKIEVKLTTSDRVGYHQYTFAEGSEQNVVVDLGFAINWDAPVSTKIQMEDAHTISGYRFSKGWAPNQKVFFVAKFSKPITSYDLYSNFELLNDTKSTEGEKTSAEFFFDAQDSQTLEVKVAVSSVSIENAKKNLASDADGFNFDTVKDTAQKTWQEALSSIQVETPVDSLKTIFYTALYHTQEAPVTFSDVNGEFRLQNDSIAKGDYTAYSSLSLWDTFRAENPLLTILEPEKVSDIINSLLAYYDENGTLPVWTLYGNETYTMTGNHAIPVIADALLKGIEGFDKERAYEAMTTTMNLNETSRGVKYFNEYGYVPYDLLDENVTITLEFSYDEWCIAQVAKALGKDADYKKYSELSKGYAKIFDKETGFMRGLSKDGKTFHAPFDPKLSIHRKGTDYTEGNAWQHSWFVPHDVEGLIALHGGNDAFNTKLEALFNESSEINGEHSSPDISGLIGQYAHGNEPSHHIAYMFNKSGEPWRTQYYVHRILSEQYDTTSAGLSGNEDCGQMSAWYVLSSIGIYPMNPASGEYEIGSPVFEKSTINLPNGKEFTIEAKNVSSDNFYIQSATLNGKPLNKTSISHKTLTAGGTLVLEMGNQPNKEWATAK
ncbi:alpha-1,2-mannosidase, putative [Pustulibacterium marinum]|uniref:Alpha-1,2-mannosidase, putative n=1 Tax=Pustulibacterium marinum TaxID=1224947 RepID=A0A1I7G4C0_9FLAO|nr:GH92 family glycosyl hydrolase [Pustulibacterium marinum]SFU43243.1 alpha-1,2-mannosidase, putative [Pustulibacterium marinum]